MTQNTSPNTTAWNLKDDGEWRNLQEWLVENGLVEVDTSKQDDGDIYGKKSRPQITEKGKQVATGLILLTELNAVADAAAESIS